MDLNDKIQKFTGVKVSDDVFNTIQKSINMIDSLVNTFTKSISANDSTYETVANSITNIKKTINLITSSISDLVAALAELESENLTSILDSSSISMIYSIKTFINAKKGDQFNGAALVIASYVNIIKLISELSEYAKNVNHRSIKKSSKATMLVLRYMFNTQRYLFRKARILNRLASSGAVDKFFEGTNAVISRVIDTLKNITNLGNAYSEAGGWKAKRRIKKSIRLMFYIYIQILIGSIQLGQLLFTGKLESSPLFPSLSFKSKSYGVMNILKGMVSFIVITKYLSIIFKWFPSIIDPLKDIGDNRKLILKGVKAIREILFGSIKRRTKGLLSIIVDDRISSFIDFGAVAKAVVLMMILTYLSSAMTIMSSISSKLASIGMDIKGVRLGLKVVKLILYGDIKRPSLLDLLLKSKSIEDFSSAFKLILVGVVLTELIFISIQLAIISNMLSKIGTRRKNIREGLMAANMIINGSHRIFKRSPSLLQIVWSIDTSSETMLKMTVAVWALSKLMVISIMLSVISANVAFIGHKRRLIKRGLKAIKRLVKLVDVMADIRDTMRMRRMTMSTLSKISGVMLYITGTFVLLAVGLSLIGSLSPLLLLSLIGLNIIKLALRAVVKLSGWINKNKKKIAQASVSIGLVASLIRTLVKTLMLFTVGGLTLPVIMTASIGLIFLLLSMAAAVMILVMIQRFKLNSTLKTVLMLILITGVLFILAKTLSVISRISDEIEFKSILALMITIIGLVGMFALIGLLAPLMALVGIGLAFTFIAVTSLLLIAVELKLLMKFNFTENDRAKIKLVVSTIMDTVGDITEALFGDNDNENPKQKKDNVFVKFFKSVFKGAAMIVQALATSILLVLTFVSVTMMLIIGLELKLLARYNVNKAAVMKNVNIIMGVANSCIDAIFDSSKDKKDKKNKKSGGFIGFVKKVFKGIADIIVVVLAVGKMLMMIIALGIIKLIAMILKGLKNSAKDMGNDVENSIRKILDTANAAIDAIFNPSHDPNSRKKKPGGFLGFIKNIFSSIASVIEIVIGIGKLLSIMIALGIIKLIAGQLSRITDIAKDFDRAKIEATISTVLQCADHAIEVVHNGENKEKKKSAWETVIGFVKSVLGIDFLETIWSIGKLATTLVSIAIISMIAQNLKKINDIAGELDAASVNKNLDKLDFLVNNVVNHVNNGEYTKLDMKKYKILENIFSMTKGFCELYNALTNGIEESQVNNFENFVTSIPSMIYKYKNVDDKHIGLFDDVRSAMEDFIEDICNEFPLNIEKQGVDDLLYFVGGLPAALSRFSEINKKNHIDKLSDLRGIIKDYMKNVLNSSNMKNFKNFNNNIERFIKAVSIDPTNIKKNIDAFNGMLEKVSTVKVDNLKTAANMFKQMAEFSRSIKGDFDKLAEVLNDKIAPLLEELKEITSGLSEEGGININRNSNVVTTPALTQPVFAGNNMSIKDYTDSIEQIYQELSRIKEVMIDGTQRVRVETM